MDQKIFDWIVIGEGLSSEFFLYWLSQKSMKKLNILQISSESYSCASEQGTCLLIPFGQKKGVSDFGDLLVNGREFMETLLESEFKNSFEFLNVSHFANENDENFQKRYQNIQRENQLLLKKEKGKLIYWHKLKSALREPSLNLNIVRQKDTFCEYQKGTTFDVHCSFESYKSNNLFLGIGYGNALRDKEAATGKAISGDSCFWEKVSVLKNNELFSYKGFNAFQTQKGFTFGSTTNERGLRETPSWDELEGKYQVFQNAFPEFVFPELSKSSSLTGHRHKLSKRRPYANYREGLAEVAGLYKNGYVLAALLTHELVKNLD